jgi:hypothetical protein
MSFIAQYSKHCHLAIKSFSRATLARVNEKKSAALYEALFFKLLHRYRGVSPGHRFKFKKQALSARHHNH